jgi:D-alanine-D-alanine ligase
MGGASAEREISLRTGGQISKALSERDFVIRDFDPAGKFIGDLKEFDPDVVFIALHGKFGEDGTIQGLLEVLGYPYTGSGVLASALAMDKVMSKKIFLAEGITTPAHRSFRKEEVSDRERARDELGGLFSYPVIVKPSRQGSTIGITKVEQEADLEQAVDLALQYDDQVIIEQFISGMEVTASVLGTRDPEVLPLIEIVADAGFYDYAAKYSKSLSHHIIPARVAPETALQIERIALRAYRALNCRQFARVDFMISRENIPYVLEVNTIPGLTETSLFPDSAKAVGISFPDLVAGLVSEAWLLSKEGA